MRQRRRRACRPGLGRHATRGAAAPVCCVGSGTAKDRVLAQARHAALECLGSGCHVEERVVDR